MIFFGCFNFFLLFLTDMLKVIIITTKVNLNKISFITNLGERNWIDKFKETWQSKF